MRLSIWNRIPALLPCLLVLGCSNTQPTAPPADRAAPAAPLAAQAQPYGVQAGPAAPAPRSVYREVFDRSQPALASVLQRAQQRGRPTLLLFTAGWCGYCRKLEATTLPDARVQQEVQRFEAVHYDADREPGRSLAQRYGVRGYPTLVVLEANGAVRDTWAGYSEPLAYAGILRQMAAGQRPGY